MEYMSIRDAAKIASLSPRTIRRAISRGEFTAYQVGGSLRLARTDVHTWITSRPLVTVKR
jgi:excisionase family DNA binding protein